MRILGWTFRIILNLAVLGIVYSVFGVAQTQFETVVVCGLILIYVSISTSHTFLILRLAGIEKANYARFLELRTLAGQPSDSDEIKQLRDLSAALDSPGAAFWINSVGLSVVTFWTLYHLIAALMN